MQRTGHPPQPATAPASGPASEASTASTTASIPIPNTEPAIEVVDYLTSDAAPRLARSLRHTGFAVLVNHPLPAKMINAIYREWLAFFSSSSKFDYPYDPKNQDGYYSLAQSETAKGYPIKDVKEFFHVYPWGKYPRELSKAALDYAEQASALARELLHWIDVQTPSDVRERFSQPLGDMMHKSTRSLLRVLHYPPLRGDEAPGALRAAAHEDINLLTLLPAANEVGLQVLDLQGRWHDVPGDLGSLVINCGDMLSLASGAYYPSTTHRVINPIGEAATRSRISMPLFLHPADDVVLAPGVTAWSFLQERIEQLRRGDLSPNNKAPADLGNRL